MEAAERVAVSLGYEYVGMAFHRTLDGLPYELVCVALGDTQNDWKYRGPGFDTVYQLNHGLFFRLHGWELGPHPGLRTTSRV